MARRPLVILLLFIAPRFALAQGAPAPGGASPCHADTIGVDTVADSLYAWVPPIDQVESRAEHEFQVAQVRAVLAALRPIPTLGAPDRPPRFDRDPRFGRTPVDGALALVWFQVRDDGRLAGMSVINWSGWDSLDLALQRAILRADSQRTLRPLPPELAGQAIDLWLGVGRWQGYALEDVPVGRTLRVRPRVRGGQTPPRLISYDYTPHYPERAGLAGLGDVLVLEYVVDTAGRVDPDSIRFLQPGFREFALEALKWVRSARYAPARIGGCAVRARVQHPIHFSASSRP